VGGALEDATASRTLIGQSRTSRRPAVEKGAGGGVSGEKRAGATHAEEMGRRVSGVAHAREIETGPEGSRAVPRENRILNLDHRKCIEQLSFVAQVATVTTIDEESNEEKNLE
jgi:hypothetical protein